MEPIVIDLTNIRTEPIAEGWHTVTIIQVTHGYSSRQGIPQLQFRAVIDDESDPDHGRQLFWNVQLTGDGAVFAVYCLGALGLDTSQVHRFTEEDLQAWVGQRLDVRVRHRTYRGRILANVQDYAHAGAYTDEWAE